MSDSDVAAAIAALIAALQTAQPQAAPGLQVMLTVAETAELLRCSESLIYTQMKDGRLRGVKIGRRRLIPMAEINRITGGA